MSHLKGGVPDGLVKGTPIPLRKGQPRDQPKQAQRVEPEVGQKRPLQSLEPAFIPNVGHLAPRRIGSRGTGPQRPSSGNTHRHLRDLAASRCRICPRFEKLSYHDACLSAGRRLLGATVLSSMRRQRRVYVRSSWTHGGAAPRGDAPSLVLSVIVLLAAKLPKSRSWPSRSSARVRVVSQQSMRYTQMRRLFLRGEVSASSVAQGEKLRIPPWRRDLRGDTRGRISSRVN